MNLREWCLPNESAPINGFMLYSLNTNRIPVFISGILVIASSILMPRIGRAQAYNLSRDFSVNANPNGAWSYGYVSQIGGAFTLMDTPRTNEAPSIPVWSWSVGGIAPPDVHFNAGTNTFSSDGGTFPPGSLWVCPGPEGTPRNLGVMRFTVPPNGAGNYRIEAVADPFLGELSGDTEFHVARNGVALLNQFLSPFGHASFVDTLALAPDDTIDLLVGRGQDGSFARSCLKLEATLTLLTNTPPPPPPTNCAPTPGSLVAWWRAEGNPNDETGVHHGMVVGGVTYAPGMVGLGFRFDGSGSYVRIANDDSLDFTNELTIELWYRHDGVPGDAYGLVSTRGTEEGPVNYSISVIPIGIGPYFNDPSVAVGDDADHGGTFESSRYLPVPASGVFHHLGVTFRQASPTEVELKTFIDGTLVRTKLLAAQLGSTVSDAAIVIGRSAEYGGEWFEGIIDEVAIYRRLLTDAEFAAIYAAGAAGKCGTNAPPPPPTEGFDLSRDFSPTSNPTGPWSYGAKPSLNGPFSLFGIHGVTPAENGVPIQYWQLVALQEPTIFHNGTTATGYAAGGQVTIQPGTTYLGSGTDGQSNAFCVARFTVPEGGWYTVEAHARSVFDDGTQQGDTDFHVVKSNQELYGRFLSGNQTVTYSNVVVLVTGDTVDFMVGRGADQSGTGSGFWLEARLIRQSNPPSPPETNCVAAPTGLVAWWPFNGSAQDAIGSASLQLSGEPAFVPGKVNQALRFDGTNDEAVAPASPALDVGAGEGFSIEAWVNPVHVTMQPLVEWSLPSGSAGVHFWLGVYGQGSIYANVVDVNGGQHSWRSETDIVLPNTWQHVGMSYEKASGLLRFYLAGRKVTEHFFGTFTPQTTYQMLVGHRLGQEHYAGIIDELSIYNRGPGDAEFAAIYAAGAAGKCGTNAPPPPPPAGGFNLSRDYSPTSNPVGPWSYGAKPSLNGPLSLFGIHGTTPADGGVPIQYWQLIALQEPTVFHNGTSNTATISGGQGTLPPGTTYLFSGTDGVSNGFGVVRFTAPEAGQYTLRASARPLWDTALQGDTDYHVVKNGVELFGRFLSGQQSASYSNLLTFAVGDTVEFMVGRGADNSGYASGLKIDAVLTPVTNPPPGFAPVVLVQPQDQSVALGQTATFSVVASGSEPLHFQWRLNGVDLPGATSSNLVITGVQPADAGTYTVRVSNAFGSALSVEAILAIGTLNHPPVAQAIASPLIVIPPHSTNQFVIALNGANGAVVLDASLSLDPDNDPLQFFWFESGVAVPFGAGVRVTNAFDVGSHRVLLVADDGTASDSDEVNFEVITIAEAVDELAMLVNETSLPKRVKRPLLFMLKITEAAFERENVRLGEALLQAFCSKVRFQVAHYDPEAAEELTRSCRTILEAIE